MRMTARPARLWGLPVLALIVLALAPVAHAQVRVTVTGEGASTKTLTAAASGGKVVSITWERCPVKKRTCPKGKGYRVGTGPTYLVKAEDVDSFVRAIARIKPAGKRARTVRSAWQGPIAPAPTPAGNATGMLVAEYECYSGSLRSTIWVDSATTYRSPSGTPGTYALDSGSKVYSKGAVKINWTSGPYAEWQTKDNFWAEYIPAGTPSVVNGQPLAEPRIIFTFTPEQNSNPLSSGWTTCDPK